MKRYLLFIMLALVANLPRISAQSSVPAAQSVFMYNFTRLIEWPAEYKSGDFIIGVIGSSEVFNELKNYTNSKMVGSQSIKIVKFNSVDEIVKCQILFIGYGKTKDIPAIVTKLNGNSTLLVSENRSAVEKGAAINFVVVEDKLKFELKSSNASKLGLKIHSNLENMAVVKY
jgi:hypothetical protein